MNIVDGSTKAINAVGPVEGIVAMAKKKSKKRVSKITLYREVESVYYVKGDQLKTLLGWPEGFEIEDAYTNCKKRTLDISGTKSETITDGNKTTTITESITRMVTEKEGRKVLGLVKGESISEVDVDGQTIVVQTALTYNGPYKR